MKSELIPAFGEEVPPSKVSRKLHDLWSGGTEAQKASLMNLVIYLEDPMRIGEFHRVLEELTKEHACRSFLVLANRGEGTPAVRAFIQAGCQIRNGKKTICNERVTYLIENCRADTLGNTVFAHLDSDLPLVFWWTGELGEWFDEPLYSVFDRLIFDSSEWASAKEGFERILAAMNSPAARFVAHDLSWTRTHQYRLALSMLFDQPPAQAGLETMDTLEIRHCPSAKTSAMLLAAWIAQSLSGRLVMTDDFTSPAKIERDNSSDIALKFTLGDCDEPVSALICSGPGQRQAVVREAGSDFLRLSSQSGDAHVEHMIPADRKSPAALVSEQLKRGGANHLYLRVLDAIFSHTALETTP